jgi:hypothetical protein
MLFLSWVIEVLLLWKEGKKVREAMRAKIMP